MSCIDKKLEALAKMSRSISQDQKLFYLIKSFIISQFNYCPQINHLHVSAL